MILPYFPENCMKLKEFWPQGASLAPLLRSATDFDDLQKYMKKGTRYTHTSYPKSPRWTFSLKALDLEVMFEYKETGFSHSYC